MTALLDAGADIEADAGGFYGTPLNHAALRISSSSRERNAVTITLIEALLDAGADVNAVDERGDTPLVKTLHYGFLGGSSTARMDSTRRAVADLALELLAAGADPGARGAQGSTPLIEAAGYRPTMLVRALLEAGADPNVGDRNGSALHAAAAVGSPEVIALLIESGAEVNARNESGMSPLHRAVRTAPRDIVLVTYGGSGPAVKTGPWLERAAELLEAGADPDLPDANGDTPLHIAAQAFDTALVSLLAGVGADVNMRNDSGETPLQVARNHANAAVARRLLDLGADPSVLEGAGGVDGPLCDPRAFAFLFLAPIETLEECLAAGFPVDALDSFDRPPLIALASLSPTRDTPEKLALFLAAGAHANVRDRSGLAPLHIVAGGTRARAGRGWDGLPGLVAATTLLDAGADVDARDSRGETPLHRAVGWESRDSSSLGSLLLEAGANVNARANDGRTPLHVAASIGHAPAVSVLLEAGAAVDARANSGHTPLHLALQGGWRDVAAALLAAGADSDARDGEGRPVDPTGCEHWGTEAFFVFATGEDMAICLQAGASPDALGWPPGTSVPAGNRILRSRHPTTPLHVAAAVARDPAVITALVQAGADVDARDNGDYTPLQGAAASGTPGVVRALLEAGAKVDARPRRFQLGWSRGSGGTSLHAAAGNPDAEVAAALIEAGADPNARGVRGETPLHNAARNRNPAVAELLLEAGADVNARTFRGISPLHRAASWNPNPDVLAVLLEAGADVHARGWYSTATDPPGRLTPLHSAANWTRNPEIVTMLVAAGADPDGGEARDSLARSPVRMAAFGQDVAVLEALLRAGANLDLPDWQGRTVLHRAAMQSPYAFPKLLRLGADPEARDADGKTPMDYAKGNPALNPWARVRNSR